MHSRVPMGTSVAAVEEGPESTSLRVKFFSAIYCKLVFSPVTPEFIRPLLLMNHQVLLIEDDPVQALTQRRALEQSGFRVQTALDGMTGVESVARQEFDAVILDAILPDLDGVDVCRAIRELPMGKKIPVIVLTGLSDEVAINGFFKAGATDFISKPAHQLLLRHRLHRLIEASRNEKALADSLADQERSNRVKSEFASMLAHDIRTPLTGMELALEVLKDDLGSENRILESLRSGIHRLIALSERLLSVYDIEADSISLSPEVFDVERFLHRCLLEATQPANRKKIHFETRFEVGGAFGVGKEFAQF